MSVTFAKPQSQKSMSLTGSFENTFGVSLDAPLSSAAFAFRLIKLMTSFILDKRAILKDGCFKTRLIDKIHLASFNKENDVSKRLISKIDELSDAIKKRYLREFALVVYQTPDEEDILEVYTFRLHYNEDGEVSLTVDAGLQNSETARSLLEAQFNGLEDTKKVFLNTVKTLHRYMKTLEELPQGADASFRTAFTDNAPADYIPSGFAESDTFYTLDDALVKNIGVLCGAHHKVQVVAASRLLKASVDLNRTATSSVNESILAAPAPKRQPSKMKEKKVRGGKRNAPYGLSEPIGRRGSAESA